MLSSKHYPNYILCRPVLCVLTCIQSGFWIYTDSASTIVSIECATSVLVCICINYWY